MASKKAEKKSKESKKLRSLALSPPSGGGMPEEARSKLSELFGQIEHQFELLHTENAALRERVDKMEQILSGRGGGEDPLTSTPLNSEGHWSATPSRKIKIKNSGNTIAKKLKTSRKTRSSISAECSQVCVFEGHRDGVWEVAHARNGMPLIGTASADGTACVWDVESGNVLLKYVGHSGSVNSLAFHPSNNLACTASGDSSAHIWRCAVTLPFPRPRSGSNTERSILKPDSSGEDRYSDDDPLVAENMTDAQATVAMVKVPLAVLPEHRGPVMSCDWLSDGQKLVTASWDHTAKLWDSDTAQVIHSLEGHDQQLTHVCTHPTQQLVVTSSQDTTFRLWDFRAPPIHSVNVFQGHTKAVNSAVFSLTENVISGSDDHTLKIWDLRNMRAPVGSVRLDCGINRISVSYDDHHIVGVPLDNRHIRLFDLAGNRLSHFPRRHSQGHRRMVYSVAWSPDSHMTMERCNFFSTGFDNKVIGWKVTVD